MRYLIYVEKEITKKTIECVDVLLRSSSNSIIGYFSSFGRCVELENKGIGYVISDSGDNEIEYDIIVAGGQNGNFRENGGFRNILAKLEKLGANPDLVVLDKTICVKGFNLYEYKKLKNSRLTILSRNCFGGMIYNLFGLQFLSPMINMYESAADYVKIMKNLSAYMDKELRFYKWTRPEWQEEMFPSFHLGKAVIHMNHYSDIDYAREKWEDRLLRVNLYNILAVMFTSDEKILMEFDKLPFSKKVCFVPFETDVDSAYYLPPEIIKGHELWWVVNEIGLGRIQYYNLWSMLLYGKKELL